MTENKENKLSIVSLEDSNSQTVLVNEHYKLQVTNDIPIPEKVYIPHEHRILAHPNTYLGAFIHLVKSSLGTGILAVPRAFRSAGLLVGVIGNIFIGLLCTHTVYILVQASNKASARAKVPSLGFADTAEEVFKQGPKPVRKWATFAKLFIEFALVATYYLGVAVYMVFISLSLTKLFTYYYKDIEWWDRYIFKLIIMSLLLVICQIREIKHLVPFSFIANILLFVAFGIIGFYVFSGIQNDDHSSVNLGNGIAGFPEFFATVVFAMEGIGSIMPVENSMPKPNFLGTCGALNTAMIIVVFFFTTMGFFGYYKYGDKTSVTIAENLPSDEILAQVAQGCIAISVFFTFTLQFYIPTEVLWNRIKTKVPENKHNIAQIIVRSIMVMLVTMVAIIGGKKLASLIELTGAIFFSSLGFIVPPLLDIIVNWKKDLGRYHWKLYKNIFILFLAVFGMVSGTYMAISEMIK